MQPLNGIVFAIDGILIGRATVATWRSRWRPPSRCAPSLLAVVVWADWGVRGVWAALFLLIVTRLALMGARFLRRRWLVTGFA